MVYYLAAAPGGAIGTTRGRDAGRNTSRPLRVDYLGGVLDNWRRFTVDHPTKAGAIAWLVLLLVFVVVVRWVLNDDSWVAATFNFAVFGVAFVFGRWFLTKDKKE